MNREQFTYPLQLIVRPFQGFWDLKYEREGRSVLIVAWIILAMMALTMILQSQYSGFLVNFYNPKYLNSLMELMYVIIPVLFWCVANWSLTTLMDGEGKFVEIFVSTCFAMLPLVLVQFPWIWLSNFITLQETAFYYFSGSLAVFWCLFLLFVGNMTVHQFSPSKTLVTMALTVLAMAFMAFLCLLFFSLIQQIVSFVSTIYQELSLRS